MQYGYNVEPIIDCVAMFHNSCDMGHDQLTKKIKTGV